MMNRKHYGTARWMALLALISASPAAGSSPGALPTSWYQLPEDLPAGADSKSVSSLGWLFKGTSRPIALEEQEPPRETRDSVKRIFDVNQKVLDRVDSQSGTVSTAGVAGRPKDWVPWHFEFFTTDLAVSAQGLVGLLAVRGSPSVQAFWRKQGVAPSVADTLSSPLALAESGMKSPSASQADTGALVRVAADADSEGQKKNLLRQIEPAVQALMATGQVQDEAEARLRQSANTAANEFASLIQTLETSDSSQWWVAGLRVDFVVDFTGKLQPLTALGGNLRLRFEWRRFKRSQPLVALPHGAKPLGGIASRTAGSLATFVNSMSEDLESAVARSGLGPNFEPANIRIALGLTAQGDVGFAKGSGTVWGHVLLARDIKKPVVYPSTPLVAFTMPALRDSPSDSPASGVEPPRLLVIEANPSIEHLRYANKMALDVTISRGERGDGSGVDQAIYRISHERFVRGLAKAFKMGSFIAESGASNGPGWKVYQLRTGFELSITGTLGFGSLSGLSAAEVFFYNKNF